MSRKRKKPSRRPAAAPRRPLPEGDAFFTPEAGALRRAVERRSAVPLVWLHNAPRWVLPVGMAGVFIAGLLIAGLIGAVLLAVLALFFAWLAFLAWPRLRGGERAMRVVVVATLTGLAVLQTGS
ncbi:DUF6703 family protein [Marinitenerispora sediminis]|uniref:Uncharacterized protein n=1 Tax=Marinitenerispora sediminis TaxID=1931232 RepID=A0A368T5Z0_9ACTN|nr:DUF6703 family protein [Marinitenerispora sediminis]RCV52717.1 hypothetical protein DEF28_12200 [Marinitenerispora sediminis]RCV56066.1 hypothetical protein DEF23_13205 [Marinitenerispora sediminis]RCV59000.1 hypothetical protein DEF24_11395 [Marinitenerispora sediminis]